MITINLDYPTSNCPLCGRSSSNTLEALSVPSFARDRVNIRINGYLSYYICACGLNYVTHYMSEEKVREFYTDGGYRIYVNEVPGMSDYVIESEEDHRDMITPMIKERVYKYAKILDIGCSSGILLDALREYYNCTVHGVEWNWRLREACQQRDIKCFADMDEVTEQYSLVILSHVLEHTLKPLELLRDIYNRLDGYLFVQVPLMSAGVPHPLVFTEASAVLVLERAGYRILSARFDKFFTVWAAKAVDNG